MPVLRAAARPGRSHLSTPERVPALTETLALDDALVLLTTGALEIDGRLVDASNATLLCQVSLDGVNAHCVYKPVRGERPLWDFPDGTLAGREVASYLISQATGWGLVPPTVLRDGPLGVGMCQLWIDTEDITSLVDVVPVSAIPDGWRAVIGGQDPSGHEVAVVHADDPRLRRLAVLDVVLNNADRKGGHLLLDAAGTLYGVDHGICLHAEDKLRTLLWGWAGEPLTQEAVEVLTALTARLAGPLGEDLHDHLTRREVAAVADRIRQLLRAARHPEPRRGRPAVPWPPF